MPIPQQFLLAVAACPAHIRAVNQRQSAAVSGCAISLESALHSLASERDEQFVVVDLYAAANSLGLLTGAITRDDVFAEIFGKFCIGK